MQGKELKKHHGKIKYRWYMFVVHWKTRKQTRRVWIL